MSIFAPMEFIYPSFLWALLALAIPIIIHLFYFRRFKKVYFTNVKFLKELKQERSTRNRLKHLLVLLSRLLALAFLVLAFAQPFIPKDDDTKVVKGAKSVSIYIDNSFSMNALSKDVSLFERARKKAKEIVNAYGPEDRFQLLTNNFEGKHQRLLDKEEFLSYLEEVQVSPNVRSLSQVIERQKQALEDSENDQKNLFLLSDFQQSMMDVEAVDTSNNYFFIPLQAVEQQNVFIDSVWFESPSRALNQSNKLLVRVHNTGNTAVEATRMELRINQQVKALKDVTIAAQASLVDTINFTITETGWHNAELNITDYPINFDDSYYFTFEVAQRINVLSINQAGTNTYINSLFNQLNNFVLQNQSVNSMDYAKLPTYQLILLNQLNTISSGLATQLRQYVNDGGSLLVFPSEQASLDSYNDLLKSLRIDTYIAKSTEQKEIDYINTQQEVFKDVFERLPRNIDLPFARTSFNMSSYSNAGGEVLLRFKGGRSFLNMYQVGDGKVYLCATSLNTKQTNLPTHGIFLPMVYKIALAGGKTNKLAYTIGNNDIIEVDNSINDPSNEEVYKLKGKNEEFIPGQKKLGAKLLLDIGNQLEQAGIYQLYKANEQVLSYLGFNFNRKESVLSYFPKAELEEKFKAANINFLEENSDLGLEVAGIERGLELWKWCLILALLFLAIEIALIRLWK